MSQTFQRDSSPTLSMREKTLLKRRVNREHNSNFRAGFVQVNEEQLHKTGIRGRKTYAFYGLTCLVVLVVLVNIILTLFLISILHISKDGMASLEFMPGGKLLRFLGESDMGEVYPVHNTVGSLPAQGLELSGIENEEVSIRISPSNSSYLSVGPTGVQIVSKDGFKTVNPSNGKILFATVFEDENVLPDNIRVLEMEQMITSRLTSGLNERFNIEGSKKVTLRGGEGVQVDGKEVTFSARDDITLQTREELSLDTGRDYVMDQSQHLPKVPREGGDRAGYKLCVCSSTGLLFAVPAPHTCEQASEEENPCA